MPRPENFDVDQTIHGMRSDFLQCRDFGHSWRPYTARYSHEDKAFETILRCSRCRTKRIRWIARNGEQVAADYDYAEGYIIKGMGRLTGAERNALRLESVMRVLPDDADEESA